MEEINSFMTEDIGIDTLVKKKKRKPKMNVSHENAEMVNPNPDDIMHIGKVTYFNKASMIIGIRCDNVGYQTKVKKIYKVGDGVRFTIKDGEVIVE